MDPGYPVTQRTDGDYMIGASQHMSVTVGAEIAVYGELHPCFHRLSHQKISALVV